jgi:protein gp37
MKITQDVREYAVQKRIDEQAALGVGMKEKAEEFVAAGAELGCSKVSLGCKNCYAERMAKRLQAMGVQQYRNGFDVTLAPKALADPFDWVKPRIVFVNSMSDLFHERVPSYYIKKVFDVMAATPQHTYQILTKRHMRLAKIASQLPWPTNVWMGVSVEDQKATLRIPYLVSTPARLKFLSIEPLIGPITRLPLTGIEWVIVGGESGPGARPLKKMWVENIHDRCIRQNVSFFFKQWGKREFNTDEYDPTIAKTHPDHAKGGCQLNGEIYRQIPQSLAST